MQELPDDLRPTSVICHPDTVTLETHGPDMAEAVSKDPDDFWSYLASDNGDWMWDQLNCPLGIDVVFEALAMGTAILVTDGSYNRKVDSRVCGAGWVVHCTKLNKTVLEGLFYYVGEGAGSYRGELLGLLAIHVFLSRLESFYGFEGGHSAQIACDNLSGLFKSKERRKKIPPGSKNADILRSLRRVHSSLKCQCTYVHVYGHQDRHKTWDQMSNILERLNYRCDELAKQAVKRGIHFSHIASPMTRQMLPMETVAVFHGGQKISGECGSEIRYQIGKVEARDFYITKLGWYAAVFDNVDWTARDKVLSRKPDMFRMWVFKQSSGFISSGKNMRRWFGSEHSQCPNCGKEDEDAQHLMHCPDPGRYALFREEVQKLTVWLEMNHTDPILAKIISRYVMTRGSSRLADFHDVPPEYYKFVYEQQLIGWDNFLLADKQAIAHHAWTVDLPQYIQTSRDTRFDTKNRTPSHALEIDRLAQLSPEDVPKDSKFLLEIDFSTLRYADSSTQNYWVHAVKAAVVAGSRRSFLQRRRQRFANSKRRQHSSDSPPIPYGSTDAPPAAPTVLGKHNRHSSGDILDGSNKRKTQEARLRHFWRYQQEHQVDVLTTCVASLCKNVIFRPLLEEPRSNGALLSPQAALL
eukprot:scaffold10213_cov100-Cyclotella_meneghiniana.AAC.2